MTAAENYFKTIFQGRKYIRYQGTHDSTRRVVKFVWIKKDSWKICPILICWGKKIT